jgi:hypothetical protein
MNKREFLLQWCFMKGRNGNTDSVTNNVLPLAEELWEAIEKAAPEETRYKVTYNYGPNIYSKPFNPYAATTNGPYIVRDTDSGFFTGAAVGATVAAASLNTGDTDVSDED